MLARAVTGNGKNAPSDAAQAGCAAWIICDAGEIAEVCRSTYLLHLAQWSHPNRFLGIISRSGSVHYGTYSDSGGTVSGGLVA